MKYEWRKNDKNYYLPKTKPEIIEIPAFKFITVTGNGNPNDELFSIRIGALFSLAYGIKMLPKKGITPEGYFDYTVFPLEGLWSDGGNSEQLDKDKLEYKIMIRQPDFVTEDLIHSVLEIVSVKKPNPFYSDIKFEELQDGLCIQMLHKGSYDSEQASFSLMDNFCSENGYRRISKEHREIYAKDNKNNPPKKLKTTLRYKIEKNR